MSEFITNLFSDKAIVYKKARPNYPVEAIDYIFANVDIQKPTAIDIGAGPGRFTSLLLKRCEKVYAIEPNESMREQLINSIGRNVNLSILNCYAEKITIPDKLADLITVAHAFHWFQKEKCKIEFKRVLKKSGLVALIWNIYADTPEMREYDYIIHDRCAIKTALYLKEKEIEENLVDFYNNYQKVTFMHTKKFDFGKIINLAESAHCTPIKSEKGYDFMIKQLTKWFNRYKVNGQVVFSYNCVLFLGNV